jgi:RHH-type proline utilization regulon transcriptional repressor/proline dehydrogenase/delta 1-pyrroline-5-carboxylate dehydrogenase
MEQISDVWAAPAGDLPEAALRAAIRAACRPDEAGCVAALAGEWRAVAADGCAAPVAGAAVGLEAAALVTALRARRRAGGVDALMHEFALSSAEGVALMCLAEALLRIPDPATAERLIRDKIGHGDWAAHFDRHAPLFVNAAAWGLLLTGRLVAPQSRSALGRTLAGLLSRGGEPLVRRGMAFAMRLLGERFVIGETIHLALDRARAGEARGYRHSFDMLGEAALTAEDAQRYHAAYAGAIEAVGAAAGGRGVREGPGVSVKLSALHPRYQPAQRERVRRELLPRLNRLARLAADAGIGFNIDAEEADRLELSLDLFERLAADPGLAGWEGLGFVVQAYQKRAPAVIDWLAALARRHRRRFLLRLVKGAYWDGEIRRAQVDGLAGYPVYTRKSHTDLAYLVCANRLLAAPAAFYPQFATHNAHTLAAVRQMAAARGIVDYEFQCLYGMGEPLYDALRSDGAPGQAACRIYAPVGTHETLLPYLVRRLIENGAGSSFVNRLVDAAVPVAELVEDPLARITREGGGPHPAIPLPGELFGRGRAARRNSAGVDLADPATVAALGESLSALAGRRWQATPLLAAPPKAASSINAPVRNATPIRNPAEHSDVVGSVVDADAGGIALALAAGDAEAPRWAATPPAERAAVLCRAAELIESARPQLMSLCIREAGKSWPNAVGEVREAADFCRYYAAQLAAGGVAIDGDGRTPGPAVCISPWNFPLAIFVGQVAAALAAGCPVLAKPAEQTPLVAHLATTLFHRAGVAAAALQLLPGPGETVGAALVADARVRRVLFTGSTGVARQIGAVLAEREGVVFVAETGGQNAMLVDSSALPEQVVADVLASGFDSAGQRCSALRVLCLQQEIADHVLAMLRKAMAELAVGNPAELATDVGPVIDETARERLLAHIEALRAAGLAVTQCALPASNVAGSFVPPTLIEIDTLERLTEEVFGPVVHVLRFAGDGLEALVDRLNATGYGLTMGLHSRIDETVDAVAGRARVGNLYVNRNMIGAVVGVQPFGGEGLSGTGPKAGGPLLLPRLAGAAQVSPAEVGAAGDVERPASLELLRVWAAAGHPELARRCDEYAAYSLYGRHCAMPGPTGERNTLRFMPRGEMLCSAGSEAEWLDQLAAVLATGNRPALVDGDRAAAFVAMLPPALRRTVAIRSAGDHDGLAAVLAPRFDAELARRLATTPGPPIALLLPGGDGRYPLYRMHAERHLCINTAAAGGNATLMTLDG